MFEKLRADWRRGRARKFITFGQDWTFEYKTKISPPIIIVGRFEEEGETLVLTFREIYAKDVLEKGQYQVKVEGSLAYVRGFLEWIAEMASDLGYTRLRVGGKRTKGGRGFQNFEFSLDRYLRGQRPRR